MDIVADKKYKVKLIRGMKGKYSWEITVQDNDYNEVKSGYERADADLKARYGDVSE